MAHPIGPAGAPSTAALAMAQPPETFVDSEGATRRVGARLDVLGGRLDVDAVPGWGTRVTATTVPLTVPRAEAARPLADLGRRELEVLSHLARGHRNRVIAQDLHISESTVEFHVANILSKLEVGSRG
ncbi:response regulator transcription factor [Streptomyces sp. NBC_01445]|uniref:response regulator transcription factor n=1 Tax=Streptomyces sp. NBC_01445 TaxID=2903869 RepID=UPI002DDBE971|nr:LuxR C-terminal-related transcriptional regulator [Streptomyces sp. NBC_01445]WSE05940.1 LuxR C-terminal-related transcriptional regulator [Streptomyces sp. NBC_01445]